MLKLIDYLYYTHFTPTLISIHLMLKLIQKRRWPLLLHMQISIHLMLKLIRYDAYEVRKARLISIHLMLKLICLSCAYVCNLCHFNASHVKVNPFSPGTTYTGRLNFNTSHVKVNRCSILFITPILIISIHLMLKLISLCCNKVCIRWLISIHLMLKLILCVQVFRLVAV